MIYMIMGVMQVAQLLPLPEGPGRHDAAVKAMQVGQLLLC
jgi:hypothetical protein